MYFAETSSSLTVVIEGKEQVASLRAKIALPIESIKNMTFKAYFNDWRAWEVRMPGTYAPSLLMAGSYWTEEGWDFVYAKKPKGLVKPELHNVLVIETDLNKYRRVIVGASEEKTQDLIRWWKANRQFRKQSKV